MIRLILTGFAVFLLSSGANAQTLKGEYDKWALFMTKEKDGKVCYITSNPSKKTGTYKIRGDVYMLVTYRGKSSKPEVSVDTGYSYKKESEVEFDIDNKKKLKFFTSPKTPQMAWAKDEQMDKSAIETMRKSNNVVVKGTSSTGSTSTDTYSLKGFSSAFDKMMNMCGN